MASTGLMKLNNKKPSMIVFITFIWLVVLCSYGNLSGNSRRDMSSPPALNEYVSPIVNNITVGNPNSARMWWAIPMASFPHPATMTCPRTSNPDKTKAGSRGDYIHYWRGRISNDIHLRSHSRYWRSRINDASTDEERHGTA